MLKRIGKMDKNKKMIIGHTYGCNSSGGGVYSVYHML